MAKKRKTKTTAGKVYDEQRLQERLYKIDEGAFAQMISLFDIKDKCEWCCSFNKLLGANAQEPCDLFPLCIGTCLSNELLSYLNYKLGNITEKEHYKNSGVLY